MDYKFFIIGLIIVCIFIIVFMVLVKKIKAKILKQEEENKTREQYKNLINDIYEKNISQNENKTNTQNDLVATITAAVCAYMNTSPSNINIRILDSTSQNDICVRKISRR